MAFWRRSKGRHALGAAVTSIPAAPRAAAPVPVPPVPPAPPPALPTSPPAVPAQAPSPVADWAPAPVTDWAPAPVSEWSFPELVRPAPEPAPVGPRVELTFRDGSSASLDPTQARALEEIAQVLTRRDG